MTKFEQIVLWSLVQLLRRSGVQDQIDQANKVQRVLACGKPGCGHHEVSCEKCEEASGFK